MSPDPYDEAVARERALSSDQVERLCSSRGMRGEDVLTMSESNLRRSLRRLEFRDLARERAAFRRLQEVDEQGVIPPEALPNAMRQRQEIQERTFQEVQVAGMPAGAPGEEELEALPGAPPPLAGLQTGQGRWTALGPTNVGGRTRSLLIHRTDPRILWAGSVGGGIWRSTDSGQTWRPVDDMMANLAVTCMVMDPREPAVLYAGTGEGFYSVDALRGAGIFKSVDGIRWQQIAQTNDSRFHWVNRLAISRDGRVLLAATREGVFRSVDAQHEQWTLVLTDDMADVDFSPTDSARAVAGSRNGKAYVSVDGGERWQEAAHDTPWSGRVEVTHAAADPRIVYASVQMKTGAIWRSMDGGASYVRRQTVTPTGRPARYLGEQGWYDNVVWAGDPTDSNLVLLGGVNLWKSTDGGDTLDEISNWQSPQSAHADQHVIVPHPGYNGTTNRTVYLGNDGGVYRATDIRTVGTDTPNRIQGWTSLVRTYAVTQFYGGVAHPLTGKIVGGAQDNGTFSFDPQAGGTSWRSIFGGDGGWCAADPQDADCFYGEYVYLNIHRNLDGGTTSDTEGNRYISGMFWNNERRDWDWKPIPFLIPDAKNQDALFIAPFALDPNNSNRILAGGASLWRTENAKAPNTDGTGPRWIEIKDRTGSKISAIAIARQDSDLVWVGYEDGQIFKTAGGTSEAPVWQKVGGTGPFPLSVGRYCMRLVIHPGSVRTVFATFGGYTRDNIWRTDNGGATWAAIGNGLPEVPVRCLAVHPRRPDFLYIGTEVGVFGSEDGGASWSPTNEGPTSCSVNDLFWHEQTLICATHGRGMFQIDLSFV